MKIKKIIFQETNDEALIYTKSEIVRYIKDWLYNYNDDLVPESSLSDVIFSIGYKNGTHKTFSIYDEVSKVFWNDIAWIIYSDSDSELVYLNNKYKNNFINFAGQIR